MTFLQTEVCGAFEIHLDITSDERGFFARTWCRKELEGAGLTHNLAQCSLSFNAERGTLRGMHFQVSPSEEAKLVRCTRGAIYDVILDLRPSSPTFKKWVAILLSSMNRHMAYVPEGCAHGFLTMEDATEVSYSISAFYDPASARGVRWNDPAFQIEWPFDPHILSDRDRAYPDFNLAQ